jgi:hypothetical protein
MVVFGAAHLYLDRRSAVKAGIAGAIMTALVFATGSLWPRCSCTPPST